MRRESATAAGETQNESVDRGRRVFRECARQEQDCTGDRKRTGDGTSPAGPARRGAGGRSHHRRRVRFLLVLVVAGAGAVPAGPPASQGPRAGTRISLRSRV